jgi:hypothetical protein
MESTTFSARTPTREFLTLAAKVEKLRNCGFPETVIDAVIREAVLQTLDKDKAKRLEPSCN